MDQSLLSESRMDLKKLSKIGEILKLQRIVKKCRKLADSFEKNSSSNNNNGNSSSCKGGNKRIKFLKRTLSFKDKASIGEEYRSGTMPKGYLAICVGKDMRRFIIPTEYLSHEAFEMLLREAEEEFGFQQEGVLRLPCEYLVFDATLNMIERKQSVLVSPKCRVSGADGKGPCSIESQLSHSQFIHK